MIEKRDKRRMNVECGDRKDEAKEARKKQEGRRREGEREREKQG